MTALRRRRRRIRLVLVGLALAVISIEVGLRYTGGVFQDEFLTDDFQRGWALKHDFSGWTADENTLWVHINSDGLRDREHTLAVPPDTVRVAVLGDSYMQGMNVPLEKTFPTLLEGALSSCAAQRGKKAEVINFGVSAYGTAQEALAYRFEASRYKPAVVILAVYTNNDIYNNSRALNPASYPGQSPYFVFDGDRLVLDQSFRRMLEPDDTPRWWRRARMFATTHSRSAQLLYQDWLGVRPYVMPSTVADEPDRFGHLEELEDQIYAPPAIPEVEAAWRVTEALILMLNEEVRAQGAELWVVTLSNLRQIDPDVSERNRLADSLGVSSLYYPDFRIRDLALDHGMPVVTLAPVLADYAAANRVHLNGGYNRRMPFGTGHWNEVGNRVAAEHVGARLCQASVALSRPAG